MTTRPLVGIMVGTKAQRKTALELYSPYPDIDLELFAFSPSGILWKQRKIAGLHRKKGRLRESLFPFPGAVYNRCYGSIPHPAMRRLERTIGKNRCFNLVTRLDKWQVYRILSHSPLAPHMPETFLYDEAPVEGLLDAHRLLFVKPVCGRRGERVYRLEPADREGDVRLSLHSLAPFAIFRNRQIQEPMDERFKGKDYIVQRGIRAARCEQRHFDIRVLVQKDLSGEWRHAAAVCRVAHESYYNTSMYEALYGAEELLGRLFPQQCRQLCQSVRQLGIRAAEIMEEQIGALGEIGLDLVLDEAQQLWIVELNGMPQKSMYRDLKVFPQRKRIYRNPVAYAFRLSKQRRPNR